MEKDSMEKGSMNKDSVEKDSVKNNSGFCESRMEIDRSKLKQKEEESAMRTGKTTKTMLAWLLAASMVFADGSVVRAGEAVPGGYFA